ncbi:hypothetical protein RvY_04873 [Ramazzottius varieornatus]|uniref:Cytochrome P450 n=1 Tax=Ramazzottius varieornatus TaxID=947166 RepID=A0A1D1UWN2_RAMVA|nr:hypothetical protein RvY_04873 [Ramazzottius varieornatus]
MVLVWILYALVLLAGYFIFDALWKFQYWKKRGISGPRPLPLVYFVPHIAKGIGEFDIRNIKKYGPLYGYYDGGVQVLVTSDPDMLRSVMVKDFSHFVNRRHADFNGPFFERAVSELRDQRWKDVRSALVPAFTSGRMRQMDELMNECCATLERNLATMSDQKTEFDLKEFFQGVTMDVIASTFFGTRIDSQNDPDNVFVKKAKSAFEGGFFSLATLIYFLFPRVWPIAKKLGLQAIPKTTVDFFVDNTFEIIRMRRATNLNRRDFLQLMLKSVEAAENGKVRLQSNGSSTGFSRSDSPSEMMNGDLNDVVPHELTNGHVQIKAHGHLTPQLTIEDITAQAVIFFLAGFETTSTALSFLTYALTMQQDIQDKLREEIQTVMEGHEVPTYELVSQMTYLDQCVNEALRLYPPVTRNERVCNEEWEYNGMTIERGTVIGIPIFALHRDPRFWNNPDKFDPDRFSKENKHKINQYTFQTFGQGPRNCIGMRFAYYEMKLVMAHILPRFRFVPCSKTDDPLPLKDVGFLSPRNGVWVSAESLS